MCAWRLKGCGMVKAFRIAASNGDTAYWAGSRLGLEEPGRLRPAEWSWRTGHHHRGIKQFCGIEKARVRSGREQRNHIGMALRAFIRLEAFAFQNWQSWFEAKQRIIREAIRKLSGKPSL